MLISLSADTAKRILESSASFREKKVLGSAKFSDDITITHWDSDYMKKHYENFYSSELAVSELSGIDQSSRLQYAEKQYKPTDTLQNQNIAHCYGTNLYTFHGVYWDKW